jgi:hypothetical protein
MQGGNLLSFFDLGGDVNHLLNDCFYWRGTDDADREGWAPALNVLFDFCPRRFHLLNDFVSMSIACLDLEDNGGLFWYRRMLLHSFEHPDLGISFNNAFNDRMKSPIRHGNRAPGGVWLPEAFQGVGPQSQVQGGEGPGWSWQAGNPSPARGLSPVEAQSDH